MRRRCDEVGKEDCEVGGCLTNASGARWPEGQPDSGCKPRAPRTPSSRPRRRSARPCGRR